jgi:hypothetical protein
MSWTCTVLTGPKGKPACRAIGFATGVVVGTTAGGGRASPVWWPGGTGASIAVDGLKDVTVHCASGAEIGGFVQKRLGTEAVVLRVDRETIAATTLHGKSFASTRVHGSDGMRQVGAGTKPGTRRPLALVWAGRADSVEVLVPPTADAAASARAIAGDLIVGDWEDERPMRACLWRGTRAAAIDLHPEDQALHSSEGLGASGDVQVGRAFTRKNGQRALLWRGSATSCVDLTPPDAAGASAYGCAAGVQVGCWWRDADQPSLTQAVLWRDQASGIEDLHALVPAPYNTSTAWAVEIVGDRVRVAGTAMHYENGVNKGERALLWAGPLR